MSLVCVLWHYQFSYTILYISIAPMQAPHSSFPTLFTQLIIITTSSLFTHIKDFNFSLAHQKGCFLDVVDDDWLKDKLPNDGEYFSFISYYHRLLLFQILSFHNQTHLLLMTSKR